MRKNCCETSESFALSGMAQSEDLLCYGIESLKIDDFSSLKSQIIFDALKSFYKNGTKPDVSKAILHLTNKGVIEPLGGSQKVALFISNYVSCRDDLKYYMDIIKDNSIFRKLEKIETKLKLELDKENRSPTSELLSHIKAWIYDIDDRMIGELGIDFKKESAKSIEDMEEIARGAPLPEKVQLGIPSLDDLLGGIEGNRLVTIAARPGMGKTAMALNMAVSMVKKKKAVYFVSIEMSYKEIENRIFSQLSGIDQKILQSAKFSLEDIRDVKRSLEEIDTGMMIVNDRSTITVDGICSQVKRAKETLDISCVFIDYIQLISPSNKHEFRYLEIAETTRLLKALSKSVNVPIICLAQLSRKIEERSIHKPILSDLKESGAIEQDSDIVIALDRRDSYDKHDRPGEAQVYVLKNRHGPTGEIALKFDKEISRFMDIPR